MAGAVKERSVGDPILGKNEEEPFGSLTVVVEKLWKSGFRHWDKVFQASDWKLKLEHGIGPMRFNQLRIFQAQLESNRESFLKRPYHTLEILSEKDRRNLVRRPFCVDGCPLFFLDPHINKAMDSLLRGKTIVTDSALREGTNIEDLREDLRFLNCYFNLGLELREKEDEGFRVCRLVIPEITKVVESAVFIAR